MHNPEHEAWLERAAIAEHDGELPRAEAEALATERHPEGTGKLTVIAGGRDYHLSQADEAWLDTLPIRAVISGGAHGADKAGEAWARSRGLPVTVMPADWATYGLRAGPLRNEAMAKEAEMVVLFPGGRGTADMRRQAQKAGLPVIERQAGRGNA